jgi:hypothetical protein
MKDYEKIIKIVPSNMKPRLAFNKRIDNIHNKLDLVYVDGVYKQAKEEQERRDEQNKKYKQFNKNRTHHNNHHNNKYTNKKIKNGGYLDLAKCIVIL